METIVRCQPFLCATCWLTVRGNFGSVDGDSAAAMRYTEVRMAKIAHELLADLGKKETVDFVLTMMEQKIYRLLCQPVFKLVS